MTATARVETTSSATAALADPELVELLLKLYRSRDVDTFFTTGEELLRKAMPTFHVLAAFPCVGYAPMTLRTTLPTRGEDYWGRFYRARPPLADLIMNHPGMKIALLSKHVDHAALIKSAFYTDFMEPDGWLYSAGFLFWDGQRFRGQFSFIRTPEQGDYTNREIEVLEALYPHFDEVMRHLEEIDQERLQRRSLEAALDATPEGRVILDWNLHLVFRNRTAIAACATWKTGTLNSILGARELARQFTLPDDLFAHCRELLNEFSEAVRQDQQRGQSWQRDIRHPRMPGLSVRIRILETKTPQAVEPSVLLEFSRLSANPANDRAWPVQTLTASERRVSELAALGETNDQIATALGVSVHTVRAHLREVFSKLGIERRRQLLDVMRVITALISSAFVELPICI